jgi:hypothetical protein
LPAGYAVTLMSALPKRALFLAFILHPTGEKHSRYLEGDNLRLFLSYCIIKVGNHRGPLRHGCL